ncbi:helix-turn-helix transcriptional regulator [Conexibacter sp. DBS9H8]|uniref:helix-turn-helix domain-containing protein n=1 Tax=Conexibacter sp. DBS9H8 TaxID=2937801 RepID=UPI00200EE0D0|nr:helix-turn-helix transcriptional regulator [Conexibacter sp. DBS9H8]
MTVNQNLKNALADAGLSIEEFASILSVDPKSVGRWIAGTSTPYPRHRAAISRALALDETVLWPEHAPTPPAASNPSNARGASAAAGGQVTAWADSSDPSAPDPVAFIAAADRPIDILCDDIWFELAGPISDALIARARAGHCVRVATTAPRPNLAPLVRQTGLELRCVAVSGVDLVHAEPTMLIATPLGGFLDQPLALLQAEADGADGLYDRLAAHFNTAWNESVEVISTVDELEAYHTNAYDELEGALDDDLEPLVADEDVGASTDSDESDPPPQSSQPRPARRWPGARG